MTLKATAPATDATSRPTNTALFRIRTSASIWPQILADCTLRRQLRPDVASHLRQDGTRRQPLLPHELKLRCSLEVFGLTYHGSYHNRCFTEQCASRLRQASAEPAELSSAAPSATGTGPHGSSSSP